MLTREGMAKTSLYNGECHAFYVSVWAAEKKMTEEQPLTREWRDREKSEGWMSRSKGRRKASDKGMEGGRMVCFLGSEEQKV